MDYINFIGWSILTLILFTSSFGFSSLYVFIISLISFFGGIITILHFVYNKEIKGYFNYDLLDNPLEETFFSVDLLKVIKDLESNKHHRKFDQRITGSETLDAFLNEIINIIISDYVTNWYQVITADDEFVNSSLKQTVLTTCVNLSNRVKGVDWTPFITKRVLEEITTHIKLFKQAKVRLKQLKIAATDNAGNTSKPSPKKLAQDKKTSVHKRNKSDTDVNWYPDTHKFGKSKFYSSNSETNFEGIFFELENLMEEKLICRDIVCQDPDKENELLCELSEAVLYLLAPTETWQCNSLKFIIIDLLSSVVLRPLITLLSDPDNINRLIIKMCCRDTSLSSELFLNVLRSTDDVEELNATYELVEKEIQKVNSRDSGGECELWVRQQRSSLQYLRHAVTTRRSTLAPCDYLNTDATTSSSSPEKSSISSNSTLTEEMAARVKDTLTFLAAISDWRAAAKCQLDNEMEASGAVLEELRSSALELCKRHLPGGGVQLPLGVTGDTVQVLLASIHHAHLNPMCWYNQIQKNVLEALEDEELTPEDLLGCQPCPELHVDPDNTTTVTLNLQVPEQHRDSDRISLPDYEEPAKYKATQSRRVLKSCLLHINSMFHKSSKNNTNYSSAPTSKKSYTFPRCITRLAGTSKSNTLPKCSNNINIEKMVCHTRSRSDVVTGMFQQEADEISKSSMHEANLQENSTDLSVRIIETGLMQEKGRSFGIYAIAVSRLSADQKEVWHVYRRYRDFYDLHSSVKEKWPELGNLPFPGKKTFQNTSRSVLERRMLVLDGYMQTLVGLARKPAYTALLATPLLGTFLRPHDQSDTNSNTTTIDGVLVNSIKAGMRTLKNMPDQFANTVDGVMDGISKVFQGKPSNDTGWYDSNKFAASVDSQDSTDEFGVALRLLEEVLGLRGLWLRRRLLAPLRTVIADRLNKKVLEYVSSATSPKNVGQYLKFFREWLSLRGEGGESAARSTSERARARLAAKVALLYACPDELKPIVGADTARRGLLMVFHLFQRREVNKRLIFVLLEAALVVLFPDNNMTDLFRRLYSCSPRVSGSSKRQTA